MSIINPLCVNGSIDEENYRRIIQGFARLNATLPAGEPITVCIDSSGGSTHAGLGLYDMFLRGGATRELRGLVLGRAESVAAIILQAFRTREISPHSKILLHVSSVSFNSMSVRNASHLLESYRFLDEQMANIVAKRTGQPTDRLIELMRQDVHFTAQEAVDCGLADSIYC